MIRGRPPDPDDHGVEVFALERHIAVHDDNSCLWGRKLPEPAACEVEDVVDLEAQGC
jgi:hypothetical protein